MFFITVFVVEVRKALFFPKEFVRKQNKYFFNPNELKVIQKVVFSQDVYTKIEKKFSQASFAKVKQIARRFAKNRVSINPS
jgi:parvulin-like peptidyl-prolyl isomerase